MPRQHEENTKEFGSENEAKRANKHANKRIIYWPPFWNKVYCVCNSGVLIYKTTSPIPLDKPLFLPIKISEYITNPLFAYRSRQVQTFRVGL